MPVINGRYHFDKADIKDLTTQQIYDGIQEGSIVVKRPTTLIQLLRDIRDWNLPTEEYEMEYGSIGAKDYIQNLARKALELIGE